MEGIWVGVLTVIVHGDILVGLKDLLGHADAVWAREENDKAREKWESRDSRSSRKRKQSCKPAGRYVLVYS